MNQKLQYYDGEVMAMTLFPAGISAKWTSKKCDYFDEEIIDFVISFNRGFTGTIETILIERECNSTTKTAFIVGYNLRDYISGKMSDSEFLASIK